MTRVHWYTVSLPRHHSLMDSNKSNAFVIMLALSLVAARPIARLRTFQQQPAKRWTEHKCEKRPGHTPTTNVLAGWAGWSRVRICAKRNETTLGKLRPSFITGIIIWCAPLRALENGNRLCAQNLGLGHWEGTTWEDCVMLAGWLFRPYLLLCNQHKGIWDFFYHPSTGAILDVLVLVVVLCSLMQISQMPIMVGNVVLLSVSGWSSFISGM